MLKKYAELEINSAYIQCHFEQNMKSRKNVFGRFFCYVPGKNFQILEFSDLTIIFLLIKKINC